MELLLVKESVRLPSDVDGDCHHLPRLLVRLQKPLWMQGRFVRDLHSRGDPFLPLLSHQHPTVTSDEEFTDRGEGYCRADCRCEQHKGEPSLHGVPFRTFCPSSCVQTSTKSGGVKERQVKIIYIE